MAARRRSALFTSMLLAIMLACAKAARAEHFTIELKVTSKAESQTASADSSPPPQGNRPRPVCHAKVGEPLVLQFFFTSNFPHNAIRNVIVRYFIAPEAKAGQAAPPDRAAAVTEGRFVMDFKPETGKVGLRQRLTIDKAGTYLVRAESDNSDADHEHFSAIDLIVD